MFKHFMKNISIKKFTRNIANLDGNDKATIWCWGIFISTTSLIMYEFWERDQLRDKIWRYEALKKNDDIDYE